MDIIKKFYLKSIKGLYIIWLHTVGKVTPQIFMTNSLIVAENVL